MATIVHVIQTPSPRHTMGQPVSAMTSNFDDFFRDEFPQMVSLARVVCGDPEVAEDLAQEALSKAHQNWERVSAYDKPGAWLRRVTINLAISRRRRFGREISLLQRVSSDRGVRRITPDPATEIVNADSEIWEAVRRLPPRQRAVVALFYQEDLSTSDIAEVLGCSVSSATSHLSQARSRLATMLDGGAA